VKCGARIFFPFASRRGFAQSRRTIFFAVLPEAIEGAAVGPGEDADPTLLAVSPLPVVALSCRPLEGALHTTDSHSEGQATVGLTTANAATGQQYHTIPFEQPRLH